MPQSALPDVNRKRALDLVTQMMAIPGKSREEGRIMEFLHGQLAEIGIPAAQISHDNVHKKSPAGGEVGNLIVKLPGTVRGPRRLLMGHVDTVPLCVGARPVRKGDVIVSKDAHTALGADNRGGAAVVLTALREIVEQDLPHPPLTFFWPVQEEIGLYGARLVSLAKLGNPKLGFNWDGRVPNAICIGATGDYNIEIEIEGLASHAGVHPEQGISAIAIAGLAIADLVSNGWHGLVIKGKKTGSSNIGYVNGGEATNVVTNKVQLRAEVRSHDAAFRRKMRDEFRKAFERAVKAVKSDTGQTGRVTFDADLKYESFKLKESEPAVAAARAAVEACGLPAETGISNGGLDANWMSANGLPTVTMGCGQQDVHTVNESLHIESFLHACRIGLLLATGAAEEG